MTGSFTYRPHVHSKPPPFSAAFNPPGTVWTCDCGQSWTLVVMDGRRSWREGRGPFVPAPKTELEAAIRFIRAEADIARSQLGLPTRYRRGA